MLLVGHDEQEVGTQSGFDAFGGCAPCIADCTLRAAYGFAEFGGIEVPSGFTQIDRWRKAMDERPSVKSL